ncbi:MAG TPA: type VI secretion system baseplate subunit TssE [Rhodothermales bacterium]|nr:type VI secretion system baseplate subunit TssE [Rhodothermales bacterium]
MGPGLIDTLLGRFADGTPVGEGAPAERSLRSVTSHLSYLFNTRRGTLPHLPDYGLPDVSETYRDVANAAEPLRAAIKEAVERFEPRLRRVHVESRETDPHAMRLIFLITGETATGERLRLETTFTTTDPTEVQPAPPA